MSKHETIEAALVAAIQNLTTIAKTRTADVKKYAYNYATLSDVISATRPILAAEGLVALTPVHELNDGIAVTVEIISETGQTKTFEPIRFPWPTEHIRDKNQEISVPSTNPQEIGSWITYMRRYALMSALGIAADDDDDDGSKAMVQHQQRVQQYRRGTARQQPAPRNRPKPPAEPELEPLSPELELLQNELTSLPRKVQHELKTRWTAAGIPAIRKLSEKQIETIENMIDELRHEHGLAIPEQSVADSTAGQDQDEPAQSELENNPTEEPDDDEQPNDETLEEPEPQPELNLDEPEPKEQTDG